MRNTELSSNLKKNTTLKTELFKSKHSFVTFSEHHTASTEISPSKTCIYSPGIKWTWLLNIINICSSSFISAAFPRKGKEHLCGNDGALQGINDLEMMQLRFTGISRIFARKDLTCGSFYISEQDKLKIFLVLNILGKAYV